uniref:Uncharacterized protein n=1 Tax=Meloidogyne enterolobii TaxID=390850 RepID=A0A6V7XJL4_MELEN|nr:unnamed protein product [Meloidogyne enterolobii]
MLAKALSENYIVDMLVYSKPNGIPIELEPLPTDLQIIELYIDEQYIEDFKCSMEYEVAIFEGTGF